jgi:hypothetical protein
MSHFYGYGPDLGPRGYDDEPDKEAAKCENPDVRLLYNLTQLISISYILVLTANFEPQKSK